ncbi:hypothetical protein Tsubulata_011811 [Turnera subulata]|uniref:C2H2-type domain-containing protein n=1 Tax=Turnera subulata TaxID=218843 RepID=A0A9Q0J4A6_9ROSI|nr:hypothetical protein Tsubulata_011811 [Turnera subulata]
MDTDADPSTKLAITSSRHRCSACHKQFKRKIHLVEHMKSSYHSTHQPKCGVCQKHCKSFESLREHLSGPLSKEDCSRIFSDRGCGLCLKVYDNPISLSKHTEICCLSAPVSYAEKISLCRELLTGTKSVEGYTGKASDAIAIDCVTVGCGGDQLLAICARVCLVDEQENIVFHAYVQPALSVTDYRYHVTGLTAENLRDAMPKSEVLIKIKEILYNGGKTKFLVGHGLERDLRSLNMDYPAQFSRDISKYRPLKKTNLVSHSLNYDIQTGFLDPYEDCVAMMRLYKRMRSQDHQQIRIQNTSSGLESRTLEELENMTPDELYHISEPDYRCWCLDSANTG